MAVDVAKINRLRSTALAATQIEGGSLAGKALADTYDQLRDQILVTIPEELHAEFDVLFPKMEQKAIRHGDVLASAQAADAAKARLRTLSGWLQGIIESEGVTRR